MYLYRYRDGTELQLVDEEEQSPSSASSNGAATPATGAGTVGGPLNSARTRVNAGRNAAKYARVKGLTSGSGGIHGDGNGEDATVLVVRRLTRFDSGRYECRVRNSVGAANSTNFANVRVQCKFNQLTPSSTVYKNRTTHFQFLIYVVKPKTFRCLLHLF